MKRITIAIAGVLLTANILAGAILSGYDWMNVLFSSAAIVVTALFIVLTSALPLKQGFKVSLPFIFLSIGVIEYVLGIVSKHGIQDNYSAIAALALVVGELIMIIVCTFVSKHS